MSTTQQFHFVVLPKNCCVVKITTQQLKTVVLWVFWTLAVVGHRTNDTLIKERELRDFDIIQMMLGSEWTFALRPRATFLTSGSSYFNVARTTVLHMFCRMANH